MALGLFVAVLLGLAAERVISEQRHFITWDRHWLNTNLTNFTLNVALNDRVTFICQVEDFEDEKDRAENIINLLEEQDLVDCNVGIGNRTFITECVDPGNRHDININDALELANRQTFEAGGVYYFTSFSNGTVDSALSDTTSGGGCTLSPPLRLIISISATETSSLSPTASVADTSATSTSSTMDIMMTAGMSTSTSGPAILPTSTDRVITITSSPGPIMNGARLLSPLHSVLLLVLLLTFIVIL